MDRANQIDTFCRILNVSRETIESLKNYEKLIIKGNKRLNLIGKSTIPYIWSRHFLDSCQVIDFIEENDKMILDIGSGAGFPGIPLGIILKERKIKLKISLAEKSSKKAKFLKDTIKELNLKINVLNEDVFNDKNIFSENVFIARAFKPLGIFLELIHKKAKNFKKIIIFLGKTGKKELLEASKSWDIKYKQSMSLTSSDSTVIQIYNINKKKSVDSN
jgi:16S rRNA (guanine527-N7)-methyltransferase